MLEIELVKLIEDIQLKKAESNYIEVKSARNGCPKIFDTLSSFSNQQNGGTIIFGVDEMMITMSAEFMTQLICRRR